MLVFVRCILKRIPSCKMDEFGNDVAADFLFPADPVDDDEAGGIAFDETIEQRIPFRLLVQRPTVELPPTQMPATGCATLADAVRHLVRRSTAARSAELLRAEQDRKNSQSLLEQPQQSTAATLTSSDQPQRQQQRMKAHPWTTEDEIQFYNALRQFGTDFTLITVLLPTRTRDEIVRKYKHEVKYRRSKLQSALSLQNQLPIDMAYFELCREQRIHLEQEKSRVAMTDAEKQVLRDLEQEATGPQTKDPDDLPLVQLFGLEQAETEAAQPQRQARNRKRVKNEPLTVEADPSDDVPLTERFKDVVQKVDVHQPISEEFIIEPTTAPPPEPRRKKVKTEKEIPQHQKKSSKKRKTAAKKKGKGRPKKKADPNDQELDRADQCSSVVFDEEFAFDDTKNVHSDEQSNESS